MIPTLEKSRVVKVVSETVRQGASEKELSKMLPNLEVVIWNI